MFSSRHDVVSNVVPGSWLRRGWLVLGLAGALLTCGCAASDKPDTGEVTGKVTLDGAPVPKATITFAPEEGRTSTAETDSGGAYVLQYTAKVPGAKVGKHKVQITTFHPATGDPGDAHRVEEVPEKIPAKYNTKSTLTQEVESGKNEINFELSSK